MPSKPILKRRLLYLVTEDWYFWSHRLEIARLARDAGYEVFVGTRTAAHRLRLEAEGFTIAEIPFDRSLLVPARDVAAFAAIRRLVRDVQPDVVHLVSLKPILLGGLATRHYRNGSVLCAFTGLGYVFSSRDLLARMLRPVVLRALRLLTRQPHQWLLAQNDDDLQFLKAARVGRPSAMRVIRGSGVNLREFAGRTHPPSADLLVLLPARLLVDKGVAEFASAARTIRDVRPDVRFVLVGAHDDSNPGAIPEATLRAWIADGTVEWWGYREDMPAVYVQAAIVCLPSYREGLPKVLLEAAACERPLVASDVPGCREICVDDVSGRLVPARDAASLAAALSELIEDGEKRERLGREARKLVESHFDVARIGNDTLQLYDEMIGTRENA